MIRPGAEYDRRRQKRAFRQVRQFPEYACHSWHNSCNTIKPLFTECQLRYSINSG